MNRKKSVLISAQEKELLQRLKNSKSKDNAFRELVNQSKKNLYFQIRRLLLNHEDTNDVLQNVYLKIYRSIQKFKEESKLSTWMYRIAYNESINYLKSKEKKYFFSSEIMYNTMINNLRQDPYFDGDELDIKLQGIIAKLPPKQKLVFQMKYYDDLKFKEISEIQVHTCKDDQHNPVVHPDVDIQDAVNVNADTHPERSDRSKGSWPLAIYSSP